MAVLESSSKCLRIIPTAIARSRSAWNIDLLEAQWFPKSKPLLMEGECRSKISLPANVIGQSSILLENVVYCESRGNRRRRLIEEFRGDEVTVLADWGTEPYVLSKNLVCYYSTFFGRIFQKDPVKQQVHLDCSTSIFELATQ